MEWCLSLSCTFAFAPPLSTRRPISVSPRNETRCNEDHPFKPLNQAFSFAPPSSSRCTIFVCPMGGARCAKNYPSLPREFGFTPPSSSRRTASLHLGDARCNTVVPSLSRTFAFAPRSSSRCTISVFPQNYVRCSVVLPSLSGVCIRAAPEKRAHGLCFFPRTPPGATRTIPSAPVRLHSLYPQAVGARPLLAQWMFPGATKRFLCYPGHSDSRRLRAAAARLLCPPPLDDARCNAVFPSLS